MLLTSYLILLVSSPDVAELESNSTLFFTVSFSFPASSAGGDASSAPSYAYFSTAIGVPCTSYGLL
jgi:hypothetical protein